MWWLIGIAFALWLANEVYLLNYYGINIIGFGVNYDYAVFKFIFFKLGFIRSAYAHWDAPPNGWRKVWWRLYRRVR